MTTRSKEPDSGAETHPTPSLFAVRRAGFAFMLASLFFAYAFALRVSPSVMVSELMRDFGIGAAVLGNLSAFYFYAYAGLQIPVGLALDRFGPRRLIGAAAACVALGCVLFATSEAIGWGYAGRLMIGAGCAFSWAGTLAIVNQWFPTRFSLLAGVSQMIAMGGAVLGQAPFALVIESVGWRLAMLGMGLIGVVLAVSLVLVVRDRKEPEAKTPRVPARSRTVLQNPQTWLAAGFCLTVTGPVLALGGLWGVPFFSAAYGLERTHAGAIVSLVFVGTGAGAVLLGWWSDRIQHRRLPMCCGAMLTIVAQCVLIYAPNLNTSLLALLSFLIGMGGSSLVVGLACGREHNSPTNVGLTIGVINSAMVGSGALFQPIIGWLLDWRWSGAVLQGVAVYDVDGYRFALGVLPICSVLGLALVAVIRETNARPAQ